MTSSALLALREAVTEQARIYQRYRQRIKHLQNQPGLDAAEKASLLHRHGAQTRAELTDLQTRCQEAAEQIRRAAEQRRVKATPQAREKVEKALASGKWSLHDLCAQFVSEGDRAGMAALVDALPYAAREGRLPGPAGDYDKQVAQAQEVIATFEPRLWTETERALHEEMREASVNVPFVEHNHTTLSKYLDRQTVAGGQEHLKHLLPWQGLPGQQTNQGLLSMETFSVAEDEGDEIAQ